MFDASIIVALIALLGTAFTVFLGRNKYSRQDAIFLEQRLTALEEAMKHKVDLVIFTRLEGQIASLNQTLKDRLDPIWDAIMVELPKLLLAPHHPKLDHLITAVIKNGPEKLTSPQRNELVTALEAHYINNSKEDSGKRLVAILLSHGLQNLPQINPK